MPCMGFTRLYLIHMLAATVLANQISLNPVCVSCYCLTAKLKHRIFGKMVEKLSTEVVKSLLRSENCR